MFKRRLLAILSGTAKFLIRFLCCAIIGGYIWVFGVVRVFIATTPNRYELKGHFVEEQMRGDPLEFYAIARGIGKYGAPENPALGERFVLFARIGDVGALWIWPAFGVLWGLSAVLKKPERKN